MKQKPAMNRRLWPAALLAFNLAGCGTLSTGRGLSDSTRTAADTTCANEPAFQAGMVQLRIDANKAADALDTSAKKREKAECQAPFTKASGPGVVSLSEAMASLRDSVCIEKMELGLLS